MTSPDDSRPTDEEVRALLADLGARPRPEPPPGFTGAVMARVRAEERARRRRPWLLAAAAAAALALSLPAVLSRFGAERPPAAPLTAAGPPVEVGPAGTPGRLPAASPDPARDELEAIRAEMRRLADEMERARRFAGEPVIHIGGSDELDLFLDLESLWPAAPPASGAATLRRASDRRR